MGRVVFRGLVSVQWNDTDSILKAVHLFNPYKVMNV